MKVAVLGGGITGLSVGHFLKKRSIDFVLYEASDRVGGWLCTRKVNGFLFEAGSRSLAPKPHNVAAVSELIKDLRLESSLIQADKQTLGNRFIMYDGRIVKVPTGLTGLNNPLIKSIPKALINDLFAPRGISDDESIAQFFGRRFHKDVADDLMSAFIHGIYGGNVDQWSMKSQFPRMVDMERKYRSIIIGQVAYSLQAQPRTMFSGSSFHSFANGMQQLPDTMLKTMKDDIMLNSRVESVSATDGKFQVTAEGKAIAYDKVICTLPSYVLCQLAGLNNAIKFAPFATVSFAWSTQYNIEPTLGVLVPYKEGIPVCGVVFDSLPFPKRQPPQSTVLTVMLGGEHFYQTFGISPSQQDLIDYALSFVKTHYQINKQPNESYVFYYKQCMPQYNVGHSAKVKQIKHQITQKFGQQFYVTGASFDGIGIPDCIHNARQLANTF